MYGKLSERNYCYFHNVMELWFRMRWTNLNFVSECWRQVSIPVYNVVFDDNYGDCVKVQWVNPKLKLLYSFYKCNLIHWLTLTDDYLLLQLYLHSRVTTYPSFFPTSNLSTVYPSINKTAGSIIVFSDSDRTFSWINS